MQKTTANGAMASHNPKTEIPCKNNKPIPFSFVRRLKPVKTEVFDTYWRFAAMRQDIFFARLQGMPEPWSVDPILREFKFTNAYRASDRVSQYLIKSVIYSKIWTLDDTVFRVLLFKLFNKIETWELLEHSFGEISLATFDLSKFDQVLERAISSGASIYSAAYIMPSGSRSKYGAIRKHRFHLELLTSLLKARFPAIISEQNSMRSAYEKLLEVNSFGKFLAYQFVTDLNYSPWLGYSEMEFVVPGPGAKDGIRKCFSDLRDYSEADVIQMMAEDQLGQFEKHGINFNSLWGRPLQLIDCQNLFCEVDKYSRVAHPDIKGISGRTRIKQKFKPRVEHLSVWYPPKWGINNKITFSDSAATDN